MITSLWVNKPIEKTIKYLSKIDPSSENKEILKIKEIDETNRHVMGLVFFKSKFVFLTFSLVEKILSFQENPAIKLPECIYLKISLGQF